MFEVQTWTICDGWQNCWTENDEPLLFETPHEAYTALAEFFEDLSHAHMTDAYSVEDYRVVEIT